MISEEYLQKIERECQNSEDAIPLKYKEIIEKTIPELIAEVRRLEKEVAAWKFFSRFTGLV